MYRVECLIELQDNDEGETILGAHEALKEACMKF